LLGVTSSVDWYPHCQALPEEGNTVKKFQTVVLIAALAGLSSGCLASRKFVRNEVKTTSDALSADIDKTNSEVKETKDSVDQVNTRVAGVDQRVTGVDQKVAGVDGKVADLDNRTTQGLNTLKNDVNTVSSKADEAANSVSSLDKQFQNRNNFQVAVQKSVTFKFDSADLAKADKSPLDEVASALQANPHAIIVLEGHTDNTGNAEYNVKLGERRVDAVRRYLAVEKNVPVYKIEEISFGADRPIAPNNTKDGREQNRAVNIMVLVPSMVESTASVTP
jgi:outer membrane protein OmpA-like peptidoglycan-associated protein